ncbi:GFA family protein [Spongiibacter taiwanensis]|uniref:GFA family protein n=1 Tax=Spongiibacter taiwanensis TaxID=1748242 RepID=UPI00203502A4|nr:GFA family protein [Spongiibacter taiwanensis]USA41700.1 GFA family protein [Spongiibacter taiwanensis]
MSEISYPLKGSCQCGQVSYTLKAPPLKVVACHCRQCQKLSTSAFSITALVNTDDVEFVGELVEWQRLAESGNKNYAKFCPGCGNRMYHYNPDAPDTLKLKAASLEDTRVLQPTVHLWVSEKQDWFHIPDGVETFDKQGGV